MLTPIITRYVPLAQSALLHIPSAPARCIFLTEAASAASALDKVMPMGDFNASAAARADVDDDLGSSPQAVHLPGAHASTDNAFGGHGRHML